jgi:general stress protein 26
MMDWENQAKAVLDRCPVVTLASVSTGGCPRPCVLVKVAAEDFKTVIMMTDKNSRKTLEFSQNPAAGLCYAEGDDCVTLIGRVEILTDQESKHHYWQEWMSLFYPDADDPDYVVLRFVGTEATYWLQKNSLTKSYPEA